MKNYKNKFIKIFSLLFVLLFVAFSFASCFRKPTDGKSIQNAIELHFIKVGQADSILIKSENGNILIDTGDTDTKYDVVNYLRKEDVSTIEYMILTHPHADHIGGAVTVLRNFDVRNVIMTDAVNPTKTYENMITALENSKANVQKSEVGKTYTLGDLSFETIAPISDYGDDYNNTSIVTMFYYKDCKLLFMGDAEKESEKEIVEKYGRRILDCDFIKIGHHGSKTSTTDELLDATTPKYALMTVPAEYDSKHPHASTIKKLEERGIEYYTTKEETVVFTCDGKVISKK